MKKILLLLLLIPAMAWGEIAPANIPAECKGKEIRCYGGQITSCTLAYCPISTIYDDNGKFVRSEGGDCNTCYRSPLRCSCENVHWEE